MGMCSWTSLCVSRTFSWCHKSLREHSWDLLGSESEAPRRKIHTEPPFIPFQRPGNEQGFREGLLFSFQKLLINTGTSGCGAGKLWDLREKGLAESWENWSDWERAGINPRQGWDTGRSHSGVCGGKEGLADTVRAQIKSEYSCVDLLVLFGSVVLRKEFCCEQRGREQKEKTKPQTLG